MAVLIFTLSKRLVSFARSFFKRACSLRLSCLFDIEDTIVAGVQGEDGLIEIDSDGVVDVKRPGAGACSSATAGAEAINSAAWRVAAGTAAMISSISAGMAAFCGMHHVRREAESKMVANYAPSDWRQAAARSWLTNTGFRGGRTGSGG